MEIQQCQWIIFDLHLKVTWIQMTSTVDHISYIYISNGKGPLDKKTTIPILGIYVWFTWLPWFLRGAIQNNRGPFLLSCFLFNLCGKRLVWMYNESRNGVLSRENLSWVCSDHTAYQWFLVRSFPVHFR